MATDSSPLPPRKPIFGRIFGGNTADTLTDSIMGARVFPFILPLLLGILMALAASILISRGQWQFAVPLIFIVPVAILLIRFPFFAVLVWLLVFPFFVKEIVPGSRYMYWVVHRLMIPGALGLAILGQLLPGVKKRTIRFGIAEVSMVVFLLLGFGNILLKDYALVYTLVRFYDRIFVPFCMYGLVRLTASSEEDWRMFVWIAPVIVISQIAFGLVSWYVPGLLPDAWLGRFGERTVGTFGNPGVFTTTLMFCAIFLFQYGTQKKSFWIRAASFSLVALSLLGTILSFSRGSWLGALIVCVGVFFLYPRLISRLAVVFMLLVLALGVTFFKDYIPFVWERLNDADTAQGRILGGAAALRMIEQKPAFGWGYNAYEQYDELYREPTLGLAVNDAATSHNTFLLIAAEMGLVGFSLYMFPLLWWFLESRKAWPRMGSSGFISKPMLVMLWLLMLDHISVAGFVDMFQSNLFGRAMWWMALGLIASLVSLTLDRSSKPKMKPADR